MLTTIAKIKEISAELLACCRYSTVRIDSEEITLHISSTEAIGEMANEANAEVLIKDFDSEKFPFEMTAIINGVTVYKLLSQDEHKQWLENHPNKPQNESCPSYDVGASTEATGEALRFDVN